jgi:hypothetical protein
MRATDREEYKRLKTEFAKHLIEALEEKITGLKKAIEVLRGVEKEIVNF